MKAIKKVAIGYKKLCRKAYVATATNSTPLLFVLGIGLLATGLVGASEAQLANAPGSGVAAGDDRIYEIVNRIFLLIEGNLGALVMIAAGLGAIIAAAFGAYRAAVGLLVVAVGAFILRSLVAIFFDWK